MVDGELVSWSEEGARVRVDDLAAGDLVDIDGAGQAIVTALLANGEAHVAPLTSRPPSRGAWVRRLGPHVIAAGTSIVGRAVDATGTPIDGRGPVLWNSTYPVFGRDPFVIPETPDAG